jgi:hypothetical protein
MFLGGLFDGLEEDVAASAESIEKVLSGYSSSKAGKALKAAFSGEYHHFQFDLIEGLMQMEKESNSPTEKQQLRLFREHFVARVADPEHFDLNMLSMALVRAFRRILYCRCFNGILLAQMKQAGLFAYWIAKMHPITIGNVPDGWDTLSAQHEKALQEINERFAFHIINSFYKDNMKRSLSSSPDYQKHFVHAIKYRSFTEDSMMLVTESLGISGSTANTVF